MRLGAQHTSGAPWGLVAEPSSWALRERHLQEGVFLKFKGVAQINLHTYPQHLATQPRKVFSPRRLGLGGLCPAVGPAQGYVLVSAPASPLLGDGSSNGSIRI